jgi:hypothetical protein
LYHKATGTTTSPSGWGVTDKIFGYLSSLTNDYRVVKQAPLNPGDPGYAAQQARLQNIGIFGLQKPIGGALLIAGIGVVALIVYKVVSK